MVVMDALGDDACVLGFGVEPGKQFADPTEVEGGVVCGGCHIEPLSVSAELQDPGSFTGIPW